MISSLIYVKKKQKKTNKQKEPGGKNGDHRAKGKTSWSDSSRPTSTTANVIGYPLHHRSVSRAVQSGNGVASGPACRHLERRFGRPRKKKNKNKKKQNTIKDVFQSVRTGRRLRLLRDYCFFFFLFFFSLSSDFSRYGSSVRVTATATTTTTTKKNGCGLNLFQFTSLSLSLV